MAQPLTPRSPSMLSQPAGLRRLPIDIAQIDAAGRSGAVPSMPAEPVETDEPVAAEEPAAPSSPPIRAWTSR